MSTFSLPKLEPSEYNRPACIIQSRDAMLTKERIDRLKSGNVRELYRVLETNQDNARIKFLLENLGRLPSDFDGKRLLPHLHSKDNQIRFLTVKNIGKLSADEYLDAVFSVARSDQDSMIRREAVSSIGRMRSAKAIPFLIRLLNDPDPKVVLQAVRGLLVFKLDSTVRRKLQELSRHPNEMIQDVIRKEYFPPETQPASGAAHSSFPEFMKNVVVHGDVREILKYVPDESIHLTFTSPPYYNARDYSVYQSYNQYLEFLESVFKEVHRITKEGRFFILNTSPVIVPRISRQHSSRRYPIPFDIHPHLIKMGWEFIDDIIWAKPEACAKNRNAGFLQHRKPLGYKANSVTEYVMVYRKKTDKLLDWNIRQYDWKRVRQSKVMGDYETSNVWRIDPAFDRVHSAVFPIELCNRVIKFYSYKGDLVFDPFGGSGTFGKSARNLERHFFLTEQEERYIERIRQEVGGGSLFAEGAVRILDTAAFRKLAAEQNGNHVSRAARWNGLN